MAAGDKKPVVMTGDIGDTVAERIHAAQHAAAGDDPITLRMIGAACNKSLIINHVFLDPVNQRGQETYEGTGYTIDRWQVRMPNGATDTSYVVTVNVDGSITLTNNSASNGMFFAQLFEDVLTADRYTISGLCTAVSGTVYMGLYTSGGSIAYREQFEGAGMLSFSCDVAADDLAKSFRFFLTAGSSITLSAVKLERGGVQTLAHQDSGGSWILNEIPVYGEELAKCQRYQMAFPVINSGSYWVGTAQTTQYARIPISLPQSLRAMPSLTAPVGSIDASGFALRHGTTAYEIAEMSAYNMTGNEVTLLIKTTEATLTAGETYALYSTAASTMLLDANL